MKGWRSRIQWLFFLAATDPGSFSDNGQQVSEYLIYDCMEMLWGPSMSKCYIGLNKVEVIYAQEKWLVKYDV